MHNNLSEYWQFGQYCGSAYSNSRVCGWFVMFFLVGVVVVIGGGGYGVGGGGGGSVNGILRIWHK